MKYSHMVLLFISLKSLSTAAQSCIGYRAGCYTTPESCCFGLSCDQTTWLCETNEPTTSTHYAPTRTTHHKPTRTTHHQPTHYEPSSTTHHQSSCIGHLADCYTTPEACCFGLSCDQTTWRCESSDEPTTSTHHEPTRSTHHEPTKTTHHEPTHYEPSSTTHHQSSCIGHLADCYTTPESCCFGLSCDQTTWRCESDEPTTSTHHEPTKSTHHPPTHYEPTRTTHHQPTHYEPSSTTHKPSCLSLSAGCYGKAEECCSDLTCNITTWSCEPPYY